MIPAEAFEDVEWSVRLLMEGERRMEHNLNKRVADSENVSLECDGSDWSAAVMVDFLDEDNVEMLADRELRRLYAAMSKLTERQTEVIQLYFYDAAGDCRGAGDNKTGCPLCDEGCSQKNEKKFLKNYLTFAPKRWSL